ncbi:hypothetical protein [Actinoplanes sp. NPDC049599]|uniref:hypothetical protein n=1 Tax=Actinoplanes sp. NPDC049599 TaxID=3363903 RepID=UPI00379F9F63
MDNKEKLPIQLIDVRQLPLDRLPVDANDVVARSLRQVFESIDDPNGVISAFQSFASDT